MTIDKGIELDTPLTEDKIKNLRAGDMVLLTGTVYGARDMAHQRLITTIKTGQQLPLDLENSTIFYVGPSPAPPHRASGSVGPTTSARMDSLTEPLLKQGLRAMIGKGKRSPAYRRLLKKYRAVYMVAVGGIAACLGLKIKSIKPIAYQDLGAEAIYEIKLDRFPLFVAYDVYGGDIFAETLRKE